MSKSRPPRTRFRPGPRQPVAVNLPMTFEEQERLMHTQESARQLFEHGQFKPEASQEFLQRVYEACMVSERGRLMLCDWACNGDARAKGILASVILRAASQEVKLPPEIVAYNMKVVADMVPAGQTNPGPSPDDTVLRDIAIAVLVADDIGRFGSQPFGHSARRISACELAHRALKSVGLYKSYAAIAEIWRRYGRHPDMPGPNWSRWRAAIS